MTFLLKNEIIIFFVGILKWSNVEFGNCCKTDINTCTRLIWNPEKSKYQQICQFKILRDVVLWSNLHEMFFLEKNRQLFSSNSTTTVLIKWSFYLICICWHCYWKSSWDNLFDTGPHVQPFEFISSRPRRNLLRKSYNFGLLNFFIY